MKNVECLSGADNKSSKMTVQNSASELDTSRFNGESSECIVQHELQQAVAMQCGKRVGPAKMPKQVQYSRTSEMSARSPFTPVPYSNTYQAWIFQLVKDLVLYQLSYLWHLKQNSVSQIHQNHKVPISKTGWLLVISKVIQRQLPIVVMWIIQHCHLFIHC